MSEVETDFSDVLFERRGGIGLITLNRPAALNSLTHAMCVAVTAALNDWARDPRVKAVVVTGSGDKAFCAGGDVLSVTRSKKAGTSEWRDFFHDEYVMNVTIAEYPKPYVSLVDGITMGGGVGISVPGDFWVASEKTLFAMPETALGLFPDVGGGYFLPRLPGEVGMYLALTGARLKAADLYAIGLATHMVPSADTDALIDALVEAEISCENCVAAVLDRFHCDPGPAPIAAVMDMIDEHFCEGSVEAITASLREDGADWPQQQLKVLARQSPTSLKLTHEQLRRGLGLSFRDNMKMEFRMVNRCAEGHDFFEGVRAVLVDKDRSPAWQPDTLSAVSDRDIQRYFAPLPDGEELQL